jgi:glycosyl transferase family 25
MPNAPRPASPAAPEALEALNRWADRMLVVSLRRATERRETLPARLAGLRWEYLDAVDRNDLDRERLVREGVVDERRTRRAYRLREGLTLGAVGCALTHRIGYERMLAEGWERLVLFEDDVLPVPVALAALPEALRELPPSWELCYLGHSGHLPATPRARLKAASYAALGAVGLSRWRPGEALRLPARRHAPHLLRAGRLTGTHAYAVTRAAARKLVAAQTPVAYAADQLLMRMILGGELEAYVVDPMPFDYERGEGGAPPPSYVR